MPSPSPAAPKCCPNAVFPNYPQQIELDPAQGKWEEAIASYQKTLELVPDAAVVYQHLGDALAKLQKWEQAVGAYRKSVEFDPNSLEAQDHLGFAFYQLGWYDEAVSAYRKALEVSPSSDVVQCYLRDALQKRSRVQPLQKDMDLDLDEAVKCDHRAIELNPSNVEAAQKALEIKSDDSDLYLQLGKALAKQGQWDGAIAQYRRAIEINPESSLCYCGLIVFLYLQFP